MSVCLLGWETGTTKTAAKFIRVKTRKFRAEFIEFKNLRKIKKSSFREIEKTHAETLIDLAEKLHREKTLKNGKLKITYNVVI